MNQTLISLLKDVEGHSVKGTTSISISGVTSDSRRVLPGMVFVAVSGTRDDGRRYVGEAIERGASAIVGEDPNVYVGKRTFVQVPNARVALSRLAAAWYGNPSRDLQVVGVTGTNGKTSVSFLLRHIIRAHEDSCGLIGTVRYEVGERHIPASRTTPDAVELHRLLDGMREVGTKTVVMEVSSHALQQDRVADVAFSYGVFTNLSPDHLDYHENMEAYFAAKRRLFESVSCSPSGRGMVINTDDEYGRQLVADFKSTPMVTYGLQTSRPVDYSAVGIRPHRTYTGFTLVSESDLKAVNLPLIGTHNVQNCLAAIGVARQLGYPIETIVESLAQVDPIPGRLDRVDLGQPFLAFVDYAHTADALRRALETLRRLTPRRVILLYGCGGGREEAERHAMGRVAARLSDVSWITNDNPRGEAPETIVSQILSGVASVGGHRWNVELDRKLAIEEVLREAEPDDIVLIAGKGHETYQEIDGAVIPFDDRLYVEKFLEKMGYSPAAVRLAS